MKYMGSKRQMLNNGLGETLDRALADECRFVDLFTGSAAVARHVAEKYTVPVVAVDIQAFCIVLAESILLRDAAVDLTLSIENWISRAEGRLRLSPIYSRAMSIQGDLTVERISEVAILARSLCEESGEDFCKAYGGWYYSPHQALLINALRHELPSPRDEAAVALAALVSSASRCAAAPGHTAQPFKADTRAGVYVLEAWTRDLLADLRKAGSELGGSFARQKGAAMVEDAKVFAKCLNEKDLVFVDPPYSAVHYSRFYHVLEAVARGRVGPVTGSGRYPALVERPSSQFSIKTKARAAITGLLNQISKANARAIITFPLETASNGLSGNLIREIAREKFHIEQEKVSSRFSTLGGDAVTRTARKESVELILSLAPRRQVNTVMKL